MSIFSFLFGKNLWYSQTNHSLLASVQLVISIHTAKEEHVQYQDVGSKAFVPFNGVLLTTSGCCTCRGKKV